MNGHTLHSKQNWGYRVAFSVTLRLKREKAILLPRNDGFINFVNVYKIIMQTTLSLCNQVAKNTSRKNLIYPEKNVQLAKRHYQSKISFFPLSNLVISHSMPALWLFSWLAQGSKTLQHSKIPAAQNLGENLCRTQKFPHSSVSW